MLFYDNNIIALFIDLLRDTTTFTYTLVEYWN